MNYLKEIRRKNYDKDAYTQKIAALSSLDNLTFETPVTFFVGENGTGKSTLLEAIAVGMGLNPEGGSRDYLFSTKDSHANFHEELSFIKTGSVPQDTFFLRAESFYNVASYLEEIADENLFEMHFQEYGGRPLHQQSHGESFHNTISQRFRGNGFYLLDEPEAAISPQNQLALLVSLKELAENNSQIIIATHSPILVGLPNATIYSFDEERIKKINYDEVPAVEVTKLFLEDRQHLLHHLFKK